ncbi:MAG: CdaR family protein [Pseudomonadota bacterium]
MRRLLKWSTIACLLLVLTGTIIYFRIRMSAETRHVFLPIEVFNLPIGLAFATAPLKGVTVTLRGPAAIVNRFENHPPPYPLDLSGASTGTHTIAVSADLLNLPPELINEKMHPPEIVITLETATDKEVPVVVNLMGQPAPGFTVVDTLVQPAMVTVSGPTSLIAPMERLITQPVNIDGLSESFRKEIALVLPEAMVLRTSSKIATLDIRIAERIDTRKMPDIRVATPPSAYIINVAPPLIALEIRGPVRALDQLNFSDGKADTGNVAIDTSSLKPGIYLLRAAIQLPVDTALVSAAPDFFTVTISATAATDRPRGQ